MLSIINNDEDEPQYHKVDPFREMYASFSRVMKNLIKIDKEMSKDDWRYEIYLRYADIDSEKHDDKLVFSFLYENDNLLKSFKLPIFSNLKDKELEPSMVGSNNEQDALRNITPPNYYNRLISFVYKPYIMMAVVGGSGSNILNMCSTEAKNKIKLTLPEIFTRTKLLNKLCIIGLSMLYFIPAIFYHAEEHRLREELLILFKGLENYIVNGYVFIASQELDRLPLKYRILLSPNFPDNSELRWWYNYLNCLLLENWRCTAQSGEFSIFAEEALNLSKTLDQKFLILKSMINERDLRRKVANEDRLERPDLSEENKKEFVAFCNKRSEGRIKPYVDQIPIASKLHRQYAADLHRGLQETIGFLQELNVEEACDKFSHIPWNGYCKAAFPAASVIYYQLTSVLVLLSRVYKVDLYKNMDNALRLTLAEQNLEKAKRYIHKCCPSRAQEYQKYIDSCNNSDYGQVNKQEMTFLLKKKPLRRTQSSMGLYEDKPEKIIRRRSHSITI